MIKYLHETNKQELTLSRYVAGLNYLFFVPTYLIGPITSFLKFEEDTVSKSASLDWRDAVERIVLGAVKFLVFATLAQELSVMGWLADGDYHHWPELIVASFFTLAFLYFNFSGMVDIAIGASALLGVRVDENFQNPFAATSLINFWNRWHITLTSLVRDTVYQPILLTMSRKTKGRYFAAINIVAIMLNFIVIGLWHDLTWRFFIFGFANGVGMIVNFYLLRPICNRFLKGTPTLDAIRKVGGCVLTILFISLILAYALPSQRTIDTALRSMIWP